MFTNLQYIFLVSPLSQFLMVEHIHIFSNQIKSTNIYKIKVFQEIEATWPKEATWPQELLKIISQKLLSATHYQLPTNNVTILRKNSCVYETIYLTVKSEL